MIGVFVGFAKWNGQHGREENQSDRKAGVGTGTDHGIFPVVSLGTGGRGGRGYGQAIGASDLCHQGFRAGNAGRIGGIVVFDRSFAENGGDHGGDCAGVWWADDMVAGRDVHQDEANDHLSDLCCGSGVWFAARAIVFEIPDGRAGAAARGWLDEVHGTLRLVFSGTGNGE